MALSERDRRALIIAGAILGVAIIGFLLFNVLNGGGGEETASPSVPPIVVPAQASEPVETATPTPRPTLPPASLAGARDPFSIPPGLQTSTPSASGGVSPSGSVSPAPTGSGGAPTTPAPSTTPPPSGSSATVGGHDVTLLSVFRQGTMAQVEVDGVVYTVEEGATFDGNFKLVAIESPCARFLYGDESFKLCTAGGK